jgi:hypothetical protein
MNNQKELYEKQRMSVWLLAGISALVITLKVIMLVSKGKAITFDRLEGTLIAVVLIAALYFLFVMTTIINSEGVFVKFFPLMRKYKFFSWEEILSADVKKYNPLLDGGGWGIRFNPLSVRLLRIGGYSKTIFNKVYYTMRGNIGLELTLANGKKVLIGTQKPDEAVKILNIFNCKDNTDRKNL